MIAAIVALSTTHSDAKVVGVDDATDLITVPAEAQPIMSVKDIRVGMQGYGLTIFQGTTIEPFAVEVLSVVNNETPGRAVIWIKCNDPRLIESGPVQGMSGSPIYLWDEGQAGELGKEGRLIGAFAFGYTWVTNCIAGVQPIELMRDVGGRVDAKPQAAVMGSGGSPDGGLEAMRSLQGTADARSVAGYKRYRLDAMTRMLDRGKHQEATSDPALRRASEASVASFNNGDVEHMLMPLSVGDASTAEMFAPLLRPMGFAPMATGMKTIGGAPPEGADLNAPIEPGAVLSIPLAFGDLDLSGAGTVTDVLPDGTVLAFGHAMYGQGHIAVPLATGYIHFVSSRKNTSFKVSSSMNITGTILRDENSAVAGTAARAYHTAPLDVSVAFPDEEVRDYHYQIVDHPQLTPILAAICAMQSVTAVHDLPMLNTMRVDAQMTFTGDRTLDVSTVLPMAMGDDVAYEVLPVLMPALQNPFEQLKLEKMSVKVVVEPQVRMATLIGARLEKRVVEPGGTLSVAIRIQPYNQPVRTLRAKLTVPADTPEGDYPLMIADAQSYTSLYFATRPHLFQITDADGLFDAMRQVYSIRGDALYLSLLLTEKGIAIGREELPQLPSSRRAMIATRSSTTATPYLESVDEVVPVGLVVQGQQDFSISVRKPHSELPVYDY